MNEAPISAGDIKVEINIYSTKRPRAFLAGAIVSEIPKIPTQAILDECAVGNAWPRGKITLMQYDELNS